MLSAREIAPNTINLTIFVFFNKITPKQNFKKYDIIYLLV